MFSTTQRHRWIYAPLLFGLVGSSCSHGGLILALLFGATATGRAGGSGEDGINGAGDTTIDISVAGSTFSPPPAPTAVATNAPPTPDKSPEKTEQKIEEKTDEQADEKVTPPQTIAERVAPPVKQSSAPPNANPASAQGNAATTSGGKLPGPTRVGFPPGAFDGSSVDGQRALLPAAAACADPVAGRWEALKYSPARSSWVHFTLTVRHYEGGAIGGTILSRTWFGGPRDRVPPPCEIGGFDLTVSMNAFGVANHAGQITFGSTKFSIVSVQCPALSMDYAPDSFSGSIDSSREEFQSLNNDGATDVNVPYVFRRTSCL